MFDMYNAWTPMFCYSFSSWIGLDGRNKWLIVASILKLSRVSLVSGNLILYNILLLYRIPDILVKLFCSHIQRCCQNPNLTSTQRLGFTWKWLYTTTHQNHIYTQCQQFLSCYWPDFDETLKVGSCHGDIYPDNICLGNICPYQEYLSCYWPDFHETLKVASWNHI